MQYIDTKTDKKIVEIINFIEKEAILWRCVHVPSVEELPRIIDRMSLEVTILLKDMYKAYFFAMPNHEIYFFCKGGNSELMQNVQHVMTDVAKAENIEISAKMLDLSCDFDMLKDIAEPHFIEAELAAALQSDTTEADKSVPPLVVDVDPQIISQMKSMRAQAKKLTVMLVDDEPLTLRMVSMLLKDCNVIKCKGAQEALHEYFVTAPHIVLMDINMPPYSGHDLLTEILRHDEEAFVVMLSSNAYPTDIKRALTAGAKGFIGKPFTKSKLFSYLSAHQKLLGRNFL